MTSIQSIDTYYRRLIENIEKLERYTHGVSYEQFCADEEKQDACYMICIVLGETATQIKRYFPSQDLIPDREMIGLRNFIAHQYHLIKTDTVRAVITTHLPPIKQLLLKHISSS